MYRIGIIGYGNLGRGVEAAATRAEDMELRAIFTRRDPDSVTPARDDVPVVRLDDLRDWADILDVAILCAGSATDLPHMTPSLARHVNLVDSFDVHGDIPAHYDRVDEAARSGSRLALISAGWDPGLFSVMRIYADAILPDGHGETFWGPGISQGHSNAIRRIDGVADARQYTVPQEEALARAREATDDELTPAMKHRRVCYVVLEPGADRDAVREAIVTMPEYFAPYDTEVHFVSAETLAADHPGYPHGGRVIHTGVTGLGREHVQRLEYELALASNPEFTGAVLVACARAVARLAGMGHTGCITMADVAPSMLSPHRCSLLREHLL